MRRKLLAAFLLLSGVDIWLSREELAREWAFFCRDVAAAGLRKEDYASLVSTVALLHFGKWAIRHDDEALDEFYCLMHGVTPPAA